MKPSVEPATLTSATFEDLVREMIVRIGEDPDREGLVRTPDRVRRSWEFLSRGYKEDPDAMLQKALFTVTYDEMVIVKDIGICSLCEHHLVPFTGKVSEMLREVLREVLSEMLREVVKERVRGE